ncbi:MAG TPA: phosphodiesterase [Acetobacteraceae bacterium]|jgi:3',5'-cyclic-AMP phosphodiesterase|nr:phosphodiesterase [Acetobacteraceae bacterium]
MLLVQLTDLHVCPVGVAANRVVETNTLVERALRMVSRMRPAPDAVILSGDLAENGLIAEYEVLAGLLGRYLDCPIYAVPGNHDRRENFRAVLGHLPGITSDPAFVQYAVETHPVRLVMLDTLVPGGAYGRLDAGQLAWLDRTLAAEGAKPTIVVMHHPPFDCGIAHMDRIKLEDAVAFAAIIARHPQVRRILCGHVHRPVTTSVGHAIASISPSVAHQVVLDLDPEGPSALVLEPPAFQVHQVNGTGEIVSHTAYVETYPGPFPFVLSAEYPGNPQ